MENKIKIILVDDNPSFLTGLESLFEITDQIEVVGKFNSGSSLLENIHEFYPDIILLDIEMPELNGFETALRINYINPKIKLIATTMYQDIIYLQKLVECGFKGYVSKPDVPEKLLNTIEEVVCNKFCFPQNIKSKNLQ